MFVFIIDLIDLFEVVILEFKHNLPPPPKKKKKQPLWSAYILCSEPQSKLWPLRESRLEKKFKIVTLVYSLQLELTSD